MGGALSGESNQFFQLYIYALSIVRVVGSDPIFAVYSDDERPGKTIRTRYDMEEGVYGFGLGVFPDCVSTSDDKLESTSRDNREVFINCIIQVMKYLPEKITAGFLLWLFFHFFNGFSSSKRFRF